MVVKVGDTLVLSVPVGPVRSQASDAAELCTQALGGEAATVLEFGKKDWIKLKLQRDGYVGWADSKQWQAAAPSTGARLVLQSASSSWRRSDDALLQLPAGCLVHCNADGQWALNGTEISPVGDVSSALSVFDDPVSAAQQFLGAPYLWGGKTVFGIDCSGLVQVTLALMGRSVPRDASMQVFEGQEMAYGDQKAGDLAFFQNAEGRVIHVGILLAADCILHAAGEVRMDAFDEKGILREGNLTHAYHSIRRW